MAPTTESKPYPFTPAEFERLYAFRQAVEAGFYSDKLTDVQDEQVEQVEQVEPADEAEPEAPTP